MARFLAVFNIVAGASSILGLLLTYPANYPWLSWITIPIFVVTLLLSGYVLFVPNTKLEENVRSKVLRPKVVHYKGEGETSEESGIVIQRGELQFKGAGALAIEFYIPFKSTPTVEVINDQGYSVDLVPEIKSLTPQQAVFEMKPFGPYPRAGVFTWVARGEPLRPTHDSVFVNPDT